MAVEPHKSRDQELQGGVSKDFSVFAPDKTKTYVRVTEDKMQAWLYLMPKEDGESYTKEELIALLNENGVVAGLNVDNLIAMSRKKVYEREIKVAERVEPMEGKNGYYEYFFDEENIKRKPVIRPDGSVDYQSMNRVQKIKEGEVLARYHKAQEAIEGSDVMGNPIPVIPAKDLPPLQGRDIKRDEEDPSLFVAAKEGKLDFRDGKIEIISAYEINADVDMLIGNVEFYGDVVISGNVDAGVTIKAGKNLTIEGSVEAASLYAGGDIILKRGIQGNHKAYIEAKGDVFADFIEHSRVRAGGDVTVNIILNSQVYADGKVILQGKKGTLIGGNVHGSKGICCKELGNDVEVKTIAHAGCPVELLSTFRKEKYQAELMQGEISSACEELKLIEKKVRETGSLPKSLEVRVGAIKKRVEELSESLKKSKEKLAVQQNYMRMCKNATVRVEGHIYAGSIICVDEAKMPVEKSTTYMEYRNISGMIAGSVVVRN